MDLPECHSRRNLRGKSSVFFCAHPRVHAKGGIVTKDLCKVCPLWNKPAPAEFRPFRPPPFFRQPAPCSYLGRQTGLKDCKTCTGEVRVKVYQCDHPYHKETTIAECNHCGDFLPQLAPGEVREWAVAQILVADEPAIVAQAAIGLQRAGWDYFSVFSLDKLMGLAQIVENGVFGKPQVSRQLHIWLFALAQLMLKTPCADAFVIIQPDASLPAGIRKWLEKSLWPSGRLGFVSLPRVNQGENMDLASLQFKKGGWDSLGVLDAVIPDTRAVCLPTAAARSLLAYTFLTGTVAAEPNWPKALERILSRWAATLFYSVHSVEYSYAAAGDSTLKADS